ncbi:MAG: nucleotide pyrophosphatase/phosphodiesterase family protein, partial [Nakamurella sp.]
MSRPAIAAPRYDDGWLGSVLPGVAALFGVDTGRPALALPPADRVCVVVIDGLGQRQLEQATGDAPFLASLLWGGRTLVAGCPSTTATSMASFATGRPPGQHGLVGYEVMDPDRGVLLNELRWEPPTDPLRWQPYPTVFQALEAAGVAVVKIGNPEFDGSGLTQAALRGGRFIGADQLHTRVDLAVQVLAEPGPGLVYLYWGDVDGAGHRCGWQSRQWRKALRLADRGLARLAAKLGRGTLLLITADHGMVDVPHGRRMDLAEYPDLAQQLLVLGGEGRFAQAYCRPGCSEADAQALAAAFRDVIGDRALVRTRAAAIADGWFGPVDDRVLGRIGDVLVAGVEP